MYDKERLKIYYVILFLSLLTVASGVANVFLSGLTVITCITILSSSLIAFLVMIRIDDIKYPWNDHWED